MSEGLYCSFCGRSRTDVRFMMPGPASAICGECVVVAVRMMAEGGSCFREIEGETVTLTLEAPLDRLRMPQGDGR